MSIKLKDTIYNTANYSVDSDKIDGLDSSYLFQHSSNSNFDTQKGNRIIPYSGTNTPLGTGQVYGSVLQWTGTLNVEPGVSSGSSWYYQLWGRTEGTNLYYRTRTNQGNWTDLKRIAFDSDIPTSLKNPTSLTIQANGTSLGSYDGSAAKTFNITYSNVGAASSSHTHNYAGSSSPGGAATSALTISASAPQLAAAGESNNINIVNNANSSITTNSPESLAAITKAIRFRWYDDYWEIGSIRGSSNKSVGFGFTINNNNLRFRITSDAAYVGTSVVLHSSNWSSYCAAANHTHSYAASSHTHNYAGSSSAGGTANAAKKLELVSSGITSTTNDTTAKWGPLGSSIHFVTTSGQLINQPSQYGMILNMTNGSAEVAQLWFTQNTGTLYHRQGNGNGWGCNWTAILDTTNYSTWVAAKSHTHDYAASNHNHDSVYSKLSHTHSYAASNHNHDSVYSKLGHTHDYAASNHTHSYASSSHTHGTYHSDFTVTLSNTTTDSGWSMINSSYNSGFLLKSIRTQASAPGWIEGNYAAGICFGGADTKGVLSCAYNAPYIKIAGGNGTKPVWWIRISGTSGNTYNLANFSTTSHNHDSVYSKLGHTHDYAASSHSHTSYFYDKGNKNSGWDTCIDNGAFYTSNVTPVSGAYGYGTFLAFRSYPTCVQLYFPDWSAMPYFRCGWNAQSSMSSYGWVGLITTSNIGSQSVNYANSAGNSNTVDGYHISVGSSAGSDASTIYFVT